MRTTKTLITCTLFFLGIVTAFAQKTQMLTTRIMSDWDESYYRYNEKGLIDSMHIVLKDIGHYESYRKYTYNDQNLCTREDDYQLLNGKFTHVSYMDYTYDEQGRMLTRTNYNSYGTSTFDVGGKIVWEYNENGEIDKETTSLADYSSPDGFSFYKEDRYIYKDGKKQRKESWVKPYDAVQPDQRFMESSIDYTYDAKGQPVEEILKSYDSVTGEQTSLSRNMYKFDEAGNLIEYSQYMGTSQNPVVKYIYHYDMTMKRANSLLPFNFEDQAAPHMIAMKLSPNLIVKEEWWQMPNETDKLLHGGDYIWNYQNTAATNIPDEATVAGYCSSSPIDDNITCIGTGAETNLAAAIQFTADELRAKGNQIFMIKYYLGINNVSDMKVFIKNTLTGEPLVEQAVDKVQTGWNCIVLDTPYDISNANGDLYIGYSLKTNGYPIGLELSTKNTKADWASINNGQWDHLSSVQGFQNMVLLIQAGLTGGDYSNEKIQLGATPITINCKKYVETETPLPISCDVLNNGVKTIRSLELSYEINGEKKTANLTNLAIANGMTQSVEVPGIELSEVGTYTLKISITKINGEKNTNDGKSISTSFEAMEKGSFVQRNVYIEQFTGQNCPYCPLGHNAVDNAIIGFEDRVSIVAHYSYDGVYGELYTEANSTVARQFGVRAAPMCMIDRTYMKDVTEDLAFNTQIITPQNVEQMLEIPAFVTLDVTGVYDQNTKAIEVKVAGEFLKDLPNAKLNIFLTEDKITAGQAHANYGWIDDFEHNHVMRAVITENALGDNIQRNGNKFEATYTYQIPESYGKINNTPHAPVIENLKVVAFVADLTSQSIYKCQVHNSKTIALTNFQEGTVIPSSIESTQNAAAVNIYGGIGKVLVDGEYDTLHIYTIDGMEVANEQLAHGLYIVKVKAGKSVVTKKVTVE